MKTVYQLLSTVLILSFANVVSPAQPFWARSTGATDSLNLAVAFANQNIVVSVGWRGSIVRSTDAGRSWSAMASGPAVWLRAVVFADSLVGVAVGDLGTILRTVDAGQTWTTVSSGTSHNLYGVIFSTPLTAFAVGGSGTILRSTDGGVIWTPVMSVTREELRSVSFASSTDGVAVGGLTRGVIINTTDGGATWASPDIGEIPALYAVSLHNSMAGAAAGLSGTYMATTDGGRSWNLQSPGFTNDFYGIQYQSDENITLVGNGVFRSTDGGDTWIDQGGWGVIAVNFANDSVGVAVGNRIIIYTQTVQPSGWSHRSSGTTADLRGVAISSSGVSIAVGDSGAVTTSADSGLTWTVRSSGTISRLYSVALCAGTGIAVGDSGVIIVTTDGGNTWTPRVSGTTLTLRSVDFSSPLVAVAVGHSGTILRSSDGGWTWEPVLGGLSPLFVGVSFANEHIGIALLVPTIGAQRLMRTTDSGISWTDTLITPFARFVGVSMMPSGVGHIVGRPNRMMRTTDFGVTWLVSMLQMDFPTSVVTLNDTTAMITGWSTTRIQITTDGGNTWNDQISNFYGTLNGIDFMPNGVGIAVGSGGTILRTATTGAVVSVNDGHPAIPNDLALEQNYPNPFNPSTTIRFAIPRQAYVDLGIFNTLGQRVATLVSGELSPGSHSIVWNADKNASGVYFCRMASGGRVLTTKLLLLR